MITSKSPVSEKMDKAEPVLPDPAIKRRGWLLGLGAAGAAAVVAKALPVAAVAEAEVAVAAVVTPDAGGYQLSPHVLRYYETARS
ncbi:formate dehydrogenase [Roseateles oligotrophus]|uniref:Formate dehydrogenase n=1 Tax=Roseateles oligotrophus TaxID=1769250 RepID=A0ABT2Y9X0_9BURK|nr:formate dehydrogenase [Roseateles oligotrophus]MCV2366844.1 formate dehydrogenase [Roseateles oligotrophus]